ncbi:hypothetical protein B0G38_001736 [Arthrobacter sp. VKM Ac-2550]|nr:hypothetical protein [Arthrobacter sp. VKM Ac-2550]
MRPQIRTLRPYIFAMVLLATIGFGPSAATAAADPFFWDQAGLEVGGYKKLPGDKELWAKLPGASTSTDDTEYKFELACHEGDNIVQACLPRVPDCDAGDDGMAVQWFWRSESLGFADWTANSRFGCVYASNPNEVLEQIADRILSEFRSLPIDAGRLTLQPSPHTLIRANTNVYAESEEQIHEIDLLGQNVVIEAIPQDYSWNYGDGTSLGPTSTPGGPLPQGRWGEQTATSHVYTSTGDFNVSLTTTFSGTYSVNGGPAIPIPGTGTFSAEPVTISVWRSVVNNFADNCLENPNGAGC